MVYTRYANPTVAAVEQKLANLEGAEAALAFASGMAAITSTFFSLVRPGRPDPVPARDLRRHVRVHVALGRARGLEGRLVLDPRAVDSLDVMLESKPRVVYAETPTNPTLRLVDLERLAERAHEAGAAARGRQHVRHRLPAAAARARRRHRGAQRDQVPGGPQRPDRRRGDGLARPHGRPVEGAQDPGRLDRPARRVAARALDQDADDPRRARAAERAGGRRVPREAPVRRARALTRACRRTPITRWRRRR